MSPQNNKIQTTRFMSKGDTKQNWSVNNPILLTREVGYELDTNSYKIGDGVTPWNELPYATIGIKDNDKIILQSNQIYLSNNKKLLTKDDLPAGGEVTGGVGQTTADGGEIFNDYDNNIAEGDYSHAEGYYTRAVGDYSHAEGIENSASGYASHAEGLFNVAFEFASHAEGEETHADGEASHTEGYKTNTTGNYSHAEGGYTIASGYVSHAEGYDTTASGYVSHAEGYNTTASGKYSHAEGCETIANCESQHVQGSYNIIDTENKYLHIVGNGEDEDVVDEQGNIITQKRSNAHTLDRYGNAWYAGSGEFSSIILRSSTPNSTKKFKLSITDDGKISVNEIV